MHHILLLLVHKYNILLDLPRVPPPPSTILYLCLDNKRVTKCVSVNFLTLKKGCFLTSSASFSVAPKRLSGFLLRSCTQEQQTFDIKITNKTVHYCVFIISEKYFVRPCT